MNSKRLEFLTITARLVVIDMYEVAAFKQLNLLGTKIKVTLKSGREFRLNFEYGKFRQLLPPDAVMAT